LAYAQTHSIKVKPIASRNRRALKNVQYIGNHLNILLAYADMPKDLFENIENCQPREPSPKPVAAYAELQPQTHNPIRKSKRIRRPNPILLAAQHMLTSDLQRDNIPSTPGNKRKVRLVLYIFQHMLTSV
jgi:hypothetical protein